VRQIAFDNPWWLFAAIAAVPLGVLALAAFRTMTRTRRGSAAIARAALFSLIALALAGASGIRENDRMAVVVVADASGSVLRYGPAAEDQDSAATLSMRRFIDSIGDARGSDDLLGVLAFASDPMPVFSPTAGPVSDRALPELPDGGTNIAAALNAAAAMIPPDATGRIVLISDGNSTTGDAIASAERLTRARALGEGARGGLPIDVVPIDYQVQREVLIEFVDAPPRAARGSTTPVRVGLRSTSPAAGTLRVLLNDQDIGQQRRVLLDEGRSVEVFNVPLPEGRIHRFEAIFEPEEREGLVADTTLANNSGQAFTISPGDGAVLIVHRQGGTESDTLAATLRAMDLAVEQRPPLGVPNDLVSLEAYDLVILAGVGADQVPIDSQQALAGFVTQLGGGLIMIGGRRSFGSGAWRGSPIEPILPVHLDLPQLVQTPEVAIAIVLDNSGSMTTAVFTRPPASSSSARASLRDPPTRCATIRAARSSSLSFVALTSTINPLCTLPSRTMRPVDIMLSTSFVAVPAFRRVDPASTSGPVSRWITWSAAWLSGRLPHVTRAVSAPFRCAILSAPSG